MRAKGRKGKATNLYLSEEVKRVADRMAFEEGISLSALINRELGKLIASRAAKKPLPAVLPQAA